jgi:hypothetical protein|nr:hypothetical protein [uncultured Butyrivibrio sp.]
MNKKTLFIIRICLWVIALAATVYWNYYSIMLHRNGIYDPAEYATLMRPVLYICLAISVVAIIISFILHHISKKK